MNDYALLLIQLRKHSKDYEDAMLKREYDKAHQIGSDLVETALKLQDITNA